MGVDGSKRLDAGSLRNVLVTGRSELGERSRGQKQQDILGIVKTGSLDDRL